MTKRENRSRITWVIVIAFIVFNGVAIFTGLFTEFGADRLKDILEIFFWFDLMCAGIISAFFGVDFYAAFQAPYDGISTKQDDNESKKS